MAAILDFGLLGCAFVLLAVPLLLLLSLLAATATFLAFGFAALLFVLETDELAGFCALDFSAGTSEFDAVFSDGVCFLPSLCGVFC